MHVQAYLFFDGRCDQAIEFYRQALGAEVLMRMTYGECPEPAPPGAIPPGWENRIMHACFRIGDTDVMASDDCQREGKGAFQGFALSLSVADDAEARRRFDALADGGKVTMPLDKTFFASSFGMVTDRFGVNWMVIAASE